MEESNLRNVAPETNALATMGSCYQSLFGPKTVSPRCHRFVFFFWGRKVRKRLGKAKSEIRPRSIPKSDWGLVRAWRVQCLVRACCGPGAGLARAWQSWVGHRIVASILLWAQDCFTQSCRHSRIAGLEPFLPKHSLVMEPALL